jgi:hypothetical protein
MENIIKLFMQKINVFLDFVGLSGHGLKKKLLKTNCAKVQQLFVKLMNFLKPFFILKSLSAYKIQRIFFCLSDISKHNIGLSDEAIP